MKPFLAVLTAVAAIAAITATEAQAARGFAGEQRVLVVLVNTQPPYCPEADPPCPGPDTFSNLGTPRTTAADWERKLGTRLNQVYGPASYGRISWHVKVVGNPATANGWWPPAHSPARYRQVEREGGNLYRGGVVEDSARTILGQAVRRGIISAREVETAQHFITVLNYQVRGGQNGGTFTWPLHDTPRPVVYSGHASVVNEDATDENALTVMTHELGHGLGQTDLYSGSEGCATNAPGGLTRARADCVGPWDIMAWDSWGTTFGAYTRQRAGWITTNDDYVRTVSGSGFSGSVALWPVERFPAARRTSVLRLPLIDPSKIGPLRGEEATIESSGLRPPYTGFQAECRRREGGDGPRAATPGIPDEGIVLSWIHDFVVGRPQVVQRTTRDETIEQAVLVPGEVYENAAVGLRVRMQGFAPDGSCIADVNYDRPSASDLSATVVSNAARVRGAADLIGRPGSRSIFLAGGVRLGAGSGSPLEFAPPTRGRPQTLTFSMTNAGNAPTAPGRAAVRVSEPYTVSARCAGSAAAPVGRVVDQTSTPVVKPGERKVQTASWTPHSSDSTGISIDLNAPGDGTPEDNLITSAFALQTHRLEPGRAPGVQRSRLRVVAPRGCPGRQRFSLNALSVPRGWTVDFGGIRPVRPGRSALVTIAVRAPRNARNGTVSIPIQVGSAGENVVDGATNTFAFTTRDDADAAGGLDIVARVVRGDRPAAPFRLAPSWLGARTTEALFTPDDVGVPPAEQQPGPGPQPPADTRESSSIALKCPASAPSGQSVTLDGTITPARSASVGLTYAGPGGATGSSTATSDASGSFSDTFKPTANGSWTLTATWDGDAQTKGATASCTFTVG